MKIGYEKKFDKGEVKNIIAKELREDEEIKKTYESDQIEKICPKNIKFGQHGFFSPKTYGRVDLGKGNYVELTDGDIAKMIVNYIKKENPHLPDLDVFEDRHYYSWEVSC